MTLSILFRAGDDAYALDASQVFKVIESVTINPLPSLPAGLMGITQHRGRIVTVVSLARLFEPGAAAEPTTDSRVLLLDKQGRHLGLWVDEVAAIQDVAAKGGNNELSALAQHRGRAVNILDPARLIQRVEGLIND